MTNTQKAAAAAAAAALACLTAVTWDTRERMLSAEKEARTAAERARSADERAGRLEADLAELRAAATLRIEEAWMERSTAWLRECAGKPDGTEGCDYLTRQREAQDYGCLVLAVRAEEERAAEVEAVYRPANAAWDHAIREDWCAEDTGPRGPGAGNAAGRDHLRRLVEAATETLEALAALR